MMLKLTVDEMLKLDVFKTARVVAGAKGLPREVCGVNICDAPLTLTAAELPTESKMVHLSFLYYCKENTSCFRTIFNNLHHQQASALVVFDKYFQALPEEYVTLCNEIPLPVIFIDYRIPYSLVIASVMETILLTKQYQSAEQKLAAIVSHQTAATDKLAFIKELNPHFENNMIALYISERSIAQSSTTELRNLINAISTHSQAFAAEYCKGLLVILSFSDDQLSKSQDLTDATIAQIHHYLPDAMMGVSEMVPWHLLGTAIQQSHTALSSGQTSAGEIVYYERLGIARVLLDLSGMPSLEEFYYDMTTPIHRFDEDNHGQLFDTLISFAAHGMDYKQTAASLFVHENTVRYRINKIKELIPYGLNEVDFQDTVSMTYKIHLMKHF